MPKVVSPREVKRKIRSVQNLKKITKAMEMVSAAKLKKVQGRLLAIRPYSDKLRELLLDLTKRAGDLDVPMLKGHAATEGKKKVAYVVFAADKGLCGSYNANVLRLAQKVAATEGQQSVLYTVGRKAGELFKRRGQTPVEHWQGLPADVGFKQVRDITSKVIGAYKLGEVDEVHLIYSEFVNAVTFRPRVVKFLPFEATGEIEKASEKRIARTETKSLLDEKKKGETTEYIFEPGPAQILEQLIPRYVEVLFYRILLEALASEHAARMSAMHNATDNASDMIGSLTLAYNKARQASITKELLDIVGGSEALKG